MLQLRKTKKVFANFPQVSSVFEQNLNGSKIVLSSSRGQGNFRGPKASRPRPRTSKCVLEAKDVLEDSTSVEQYQMLVKSNGRRSVNVLFSTLSKQVIAKYSNHKIWCILGLGLSLLFIYIIYNFSKRTFSALPLALFRNI